MTPTPRINGFWCIQEAIHTASILSVMIDATLRTVEEIHACRFKTKDEMKLLGGTSLQMQWKLREFIYIGCAKFAEDALNNANEVAQKDFKIWEPTLQILDDIREVKKLRHIANVIKHNNSYVSVDSGSNSAISLVNDYGFVDETPLRAMDFCYGRELRDSLLTSVYHCYRFAFSLFIHYGIINPSLKRKALKDIPAYMLHMFVYELPHHPEYHKER